MLTVDKFVDNLVSKKVHKDYPNQIHTTIGLDNMKGANQFPIGESAKRFNYKTPASIENTLFTRNTKPFSPPIHHTKPLHTQPYLYNNLHPTTPYSTNSRMEAGYMNGLYGIPLHKDFIPMETNVYKPVTTQQYIASNIREREASTSGITMDNEGDREDFLNSPVVQTIIKKDIDVYGDITHTESLVPFEKYDPWKAGKKLIGSLTGLRKNDHGEVGKTNPVTKSVQAQLAFPTEEETAAGGGAGPSTKLSPKQPRVMLSRPKSAGVKQSVTSFVEDDVSSASSSTKEKEPVRPRAASAAREAGSELKKAGNLELTPIGELEKGRKLFDRMFRRLNPTELKSTHEEDFKKTADIVSNLDEKGIDLMKRLKSSIEEHTSYNGFIAADKIEEVRATIEAELLLEGITAKVPKTMKKSITIINWIATQQLNSIKPLNPTVRPQSAKPKSARNITKKPVAVVSQDIDEIIPDESQEPEPVDGRRLRTGLGGNLN